MSLYNTVVLEQGFSIPLGTPRQYFTRSFSLPHQLLVSKYTETYTVHKISDDLSLCERQIIVLQEKERCKELENNLAALLYWLMAPLSALQY